MKACTHVTWHMLFGFKLDGSLLLNIQADEWEARKEGIWNERGGISKSFSLYIINPSRDHRIHAVIFLLPHASPHIMGRSWGEVFIIMET